MIEGDKRKLIRGVEASFNQLASQPSLADLQDVFGLEQKSAVVQATLIHLKNLGITVQEKPLGTKDNGLISAAPHGIIVVYSLGLSPSEKMARIIIGIA